LISRTTLFFILLLAANLFAQKSSENLLDISNRIKFGNYLYKEKDFIRSIDEYKIILQSYDDDTIKFRFAKSFFNLHRFNEAAENFKTLFLSQSLSEEAKLFYFQSYFFQNDFSTFRKITSRQIYFPECYSKEVKRLISISYLLSDEKLPEQKSLLEPFDDSLQTKLYLFYQLKKNPPQKNPTTAAVFSALIPGAGKIYNGEISDGIIAFLATTVSAYLAVNNFQHDHNFRGWFFTGLTSFFYGGNVYGSFLSAKNFNVTAKENLQTEIKTFFEKRNYTMPEIDF